MEGSHINNNSLDTLWQVATPEGCQINLPVAGVSARALAWVIDFVVRALIAATFFFIFSFFGKIGFALIAVGSFVLEWFYPILFEVLWQGRTPGKNQLGLAVVHVDGTQVGWRASFIRNILRIIDFLPFLYATGIVTMFLSGGGRRLGDLAAGTIVIHADYRKKPTRLKQTNAPLTTEVDVAPIALTKEEQQAIIEYAQRASQLTSERASELALLATPLTNGLSGQEAQLRLRRIANGLMGTINTTDK